MFSPAVQYIAQLITITPMILVCQSVENELTLKVCCNVILRSDSLLNLNQKVTLHHSLRHSSRLPVTEIHFADTAAVYNWTTGAIRHIKLIN
jgi:hypothetical protein